jgi:hypothetical protein
MAGLRLACAVALLLLWSPMLWPASGTADASSGSASGIVFLDRNRNLSRDAGEPGIAGVCVSNGREVRRTREDGTFRLTRLEGGSIFVIKPAGYRLPVNRYNIPLFSSPPGAGGLREQAPGGKKRSSSPPEGIELALWPGKKVSSFRVLLIGDVQAGDHRELRYLRDGVLGGLVDLSPRFAVSLGDNVDDDLSLYPRYVRLMSVLGTPVHNVPGNHDLDRGARHDEGSLDTFKRFFGPAYYAFNHGRVHFVVLDDVRWQGGDYRAELGELQLRWLENDLEHVPRGRLVVLLMHMPVVSWIDRDAPKQLLADREELYAILRGRKVLAVSGHTHTAERLLTGEEFEGWGSPLPFPQLIAGAACGSWWSGPEDEAGIPFSYQREGAPKGCMLLAFEGTDYTGEYMAAGKPAGRGMHVSFAGPLPQPGTLTQQGLSETRVAVNVYAGGRDTRVTCSVDGRKERVMRRDFRTPDPFARRAARGVDRWIRPGGSSHLWTAPLPEELDPGVHIIRIRVEGAFGHVLRASRIFEIRP